MNFTSDDVKQLYTRALDFAYCFIRFNVSIQTYQILGSMNNNLLFLLVLLQYSFYYDFLKWGGRIEFSSMLF